MNPPNILTRLSSWTSESVLQLDPCLLFGILIFITLIYKISVKKFCVSPCNRTRGDHIILHIFPKPFKNEERFNIRKSTISGHILSLENEIIFCLRRVCHLHFERQYNTWTNRLTYNAVSTCGIVELYPETPSIGFHSEFNFQGLDRKEHNTLERRMHNVIIYFLCWFATHAISHAHIQSLCMCAMANTLHRKTRDPVRPPLQDLTNTMNLDTENSEVNTKTDRFIEPKL